MLLHKKVNQYKNSVFVLFLLLTLPGNAQEAYNWMTHSSKKTVTEAVMSGNKIWAATSGGAFCYNLKDSSFLTITRSDGLKGISLQAIAVDTYGKIWLGSQDGCVDIYDPATKEIKTIYDIFNSNNVQKGINSFMITGDSIFACTDIGIVVFNTVTYKSLDTYVNLGSFPAKIPVYGCFSNGRLFAATNQGVAVQKVGSTNLAAKESWDNFTVEAGLPSNDVTGFISSGNLVLAETSAGIGKWNGTNWSNLYGGFSPFLIKDIKVQGDSLFVLTPDALWVLTNNFTVRTKLSDLEYTGENIISPEQPYYISSSNGITRINPSDKAYIFPNSPNANLFNNLSVDTKGNIWASSGKNNKGKGTYFYDGAQWQNFNQSSLTNFPSNDVYNVSSLADGKTYLGTWGAGLISIDPQGNFTQYSYKINSPLLGITPSPSFVVVTDAKMDSEGNLWILNYWSAEKKMLSCLTNDSFWYSFPNYADTAYSDPVDGPQYMRLLIDQNDTKWFTSNSAGGLGLYYFNENKTFTKTNDDHYGYLSEVTELSGKTVNDIKIDKKGELWIATSSGMFVMYDPTDVLTSASSFSLENIFSLRQYGITCFAVDALNRKWVGTNQGLLLISSDGGSVIASYTTQNSPLMSNQVMSLAVDETRGIIYVGLDNGLMSFSTIAIKPNQDFSSLKVYPNPFISSNNSSGVTIDGLIQDSEIKILDITGKVVNTFETPGGRTARWNGRDKNNSPISSGVYFVVAYDKEGNSIGVQKFVAIKK